MATEHPLAFGLIVTILFILMTILSVLLGIVWPGEPYGQYIGSTIWAGACERRGVCAYASDGDWLLKWR